MENVIAHLERADLLRRLRHPAVIAAALAHLALAVGLAFVPLFDPLNFERAFATGVLTGGTAPLLGWALASRRGGVAPDAEPNAAPRWGSSFALALIVQGVLLLPTVVAGWTVEQLGTRCNAEAGVVYLALLPGAGAVFGVAYGLWLRSFFGRAGAYGVLVLPVAHFVGALLVLYAHPQIWAYDPLLGFWPGSLYDEALRPTTALFAHRGMTVAMGLALVAAGAATRPPASTEMRRTAAALAAVLAAGAAAFAHANRDDLGFGTGYANIRDALSLVKTTPHFAIHLPPGTDPKRVEQIALDHEFWLAQLEPFFERTPSERIDSYYYASAGQKAQLMGAANTKIARPWAREMHLHGLSYPHRSLPHELAHVLAAEWAPGPLHVPALFFVWPQIGIVEGVAVAAHWPVDHATVHEKARALLALELLPDVRHTMSWTGFWRQASSRAYTAAGSFLRWIHDERGALAVSELYRTGSIPEALGAPVDEVVSAWERFLREREPREAVVAWAESRYRRPSIFSRACPHETAELAAQARGALSSRRIDGAIPFVERILEMRRDPAWILAVARSAAQAGRREVAQAWLERVAEDELSRARQREHLEVRASLAWRAGDLSGARRLFERAEALAVSYDVERLEAARVAATTTSTRTATTLLGYLEGDYPGEAGLAHLVATREPSGLVDYLVARRFDGAGATDLAHRRTRRALEAGLPNALASEARLMSARQMVQKGQPAAAAKAFGELARTARRPAVRAEAEQWRARARFIERWPKTPRNDRTSEEP